MDKLYFNQNIECNVFNCIHCDKEEEKCMLSRIKVTKQNKNVNKEKETFCECFESSD